MSDIFRTMIVNEQNAQLVRDIAASFGPGGEGMWTTPLSADGLEPASHYISTGYIPPEFAYLVPFQTWAQDEDGAWIMTSSEPGDPVSVYNLAVEEGIICTQDEVDDLFANSDVTDQDPFIAMGRVGVQIVQEPMQ